MDGSDSSIKKILDQISRDDAKAAVNEVRDILLRDLKNSDENSINVEENRRNDDIENITNDSSAFLTKNSPRAHRRNEKDDDSNDLAFTIDKNSETYKAIYSTVEWYRDAYIIGTEFADRRKNEKNGYNAVGYDAIKFAEIGNKLFNSNINYETFFGKQLNYPKASEFTGLGHPFLTEYAEWYVNNYAVDLLRPTATWLVSKNGPMMQPAIQSMAGTIPMMQQTADDAMRSNVLWMLQDQEWKDWAKSLTTQYVSRSPKDN